MRTVARYVSTFSPSSAISNSDTRAHRTPRPVSPATSTAFAAASAKLFGETPTTSMTFWTTGFTCSGIADRHKSPWVGPPPRTARPGTSPLVQRDELLFLEDSVPARVEFLDGGPPVLFSCELFCIP